MNLRILACIVPQGVTTRNEVAGPPRQEQPGSKSRPSISPRWTGAPRFQGRARRRQRFPTSNPRGERLFRRRSSPDPGASPSKMEGEPPKSCRTPSSHGSSRAGRSLAINHAPASSPFGTTSAWMKAGPAWVKESSVDSSQVDRRTAFQGASSAAAPFSDIKPPR